MGPGGQFCRKSVGDAEQGLDDQMRKVQDMEAFIFAVMDMQRPSGTDASISGAHGSARRVP
jgi:hypothetical protein